jgi:hypothetical protein
MASPYQKWYEMVGNLKDDSEDPYMTQQFIFRVFRELRRAKIKEKGKFKNRTGSEFEQWVKLLEETYPKEMVAEILNDDDFWLELLKLTQKF